MTESTTSTTRTTTAPIALSDATLGDLPDGVRVPTYDRSTITPGIVHIGVGGFHRAHLAMYVDDLLQAGGSDNWGIVGVGLLPHDERICSVLTEQDGLYTLVVKQPDGTRDSRVIGSILRCLHAPSDPRAVLDTMADPATRIVSLTITEGGYLVDQSTGEVQVDDAQVRAETRPGADPQTAFGYIIAALRARREAGTPPFTVMSCDNLPGNGQVTKKTLTAIARLQDPDFADWIEQEVSFPDAMVDRITPRTSEEDIETLEASTGIRDGWPVVCEPYTQWVLEDHFGLERPAFEAVGAQVVDDVEPFELMKLRLLNASHQSLCYLGYLAGYRYAHEVCQDDLFVDFLLGYMREEGSPTLPPVPDTDLEEYRTTLIERFANPEVRDTLARLCAESSDRIPKWLVPVIRHNLEHDGRIDHAALVVAAWCRYAEGVDEQGEAIEVDDRLKEQVMAAAQEAKEDPKAFLADPALFGDLGQNKSFVQAFSSALKSLHARGARASVQALVRG